MGVMSIRKYAVHTFQRQNVTNGRISTDKESNDKVFYLKKWQHVITLKKQKSDSKKSEKWSTPLESWWRSIIMFMKVPTE